MPTDFFGRVAEVFNRYGMSMLQGAFFHDNPVLIIDDFLYFLNANLLLVISKKD